MIAEAIHESSLLLCVCQVSSLLDQYDTMLTYSIDIDAVLVAAGIDHSLAITRHRKAFSWGFSDSFRTGLATDDSVSEPTLLRAKELGPITFAGCGGRSHAEPSDLTCPPSWHASRAHEHQSKRLDPHRQMAEAFGCCLTCRRTKSLSCVQRAPAREPKGGLRHHRNPSLCLHRARRGGSWGPGRRSYASWAELVGSNLQRRGAVVAVCYC